MKVFLGLCMTILAATSQAAAPTVTGCEWRLAPWQENGRVSNLVVISCSFDQNVYTMEGGKRIPVSGLTGVEPVVYTYTFGTYQFNYTFNYPKTFTFLGGTGQLCCRSKCTNQTLNFFLFPLPSTDAPLLSFIGAFSGASVPSSPDDSKLNWIYVVDQNKAVVNNIAEFRSCLAANQLTFEYGPGTLAQCRAKYPKSNCQVLGSDGTPATRGHKVTLGAENPGKCRPLAVKQTSENLKKVLNSQVKAIAGSTQLSNLQSLLAAYQAQKSFVACERLLKSLVVFKQVQKNIGVSTACQYDYSSQQTQYKRDPCCWSFQKQCCVPRQLTRPFSTIESVKTSVISSQCSDSTTAQRTLLLFQQDTNQLASEQTLVVDVNEETNNLNTIYNKCVDEIVRGSQTCETDDDCWTNVCNFQDSSGRPSTTGKCGQGDNVYVPLLACVLAELKENELVVKTVMKIANATGTTPREIAESAVPYLRQFEVTDCAGGGYDAWNARAKFEYKLNSTTGNFERTFVPANATKCLERKQCTWSTFASQAECAAKNSVSTHFCARCYGSWCPEVSEFSRCEVGGYQVYGNAAKCAAAGGQLIKYSRYGSAVCVDKSRATAAQCNPLSVCAGPNSVQKWFRYRRYSCWSPMCYSNETRQTCRNGRYWDSNMANGNGLCRFYSFRPESSNKTLCEATPGQKYHPGTLWYSGKYDTKQKCEAPKCQFYGRYQLEDLSAANCRAQRVCDQTCARCVSGSPSISNPVDQDYCIVVKNTTCSGNTNLNTTHCLLSGVNMTECAASNGMYASCAQYGRSQCYSSGTLKTKMQCQWSYNAPCSQSECLKVGKGYCTDGSVVDSSTPNKTRCIFPFLNVAGTNIPSDSCNSSFAVRVPNGCGAKNSAWNRDEMACKAQGGTFYRRRKTRAECLAEKACNRYGYPIAMSAAACDGCDGQVVPLFQWIAPRLTPGVPVKLKWLKREYKTVNQVIKSIPNEMVQSLVERALMQVLGRRLIKKMRRETFGKLLAYERLACACIPSGSSQAATTFCQSIKNQTYSVVRDSCTCTNGVCDPTCPFQCGANTTCSYEVRQFYGSGYAKTNTRRMLLANDYTPYEIVKDAQGNIVGQIIGNADQYSGSLSGSYRLCLTIDVASIPQGSAYTIYDFAPGVGVSGAPGTPMGWSLKPTDNKICNTVMDKRVYWPIKRLAPGKTRAPTARGQTSSPTIKATATTKSTAGSATRKCGSVWVAAVVTTIFWVVQSL